MIIAVNLALTAETIATFIVEECVIVGTLGRTENWRRESLKIRMVAKNKIRQ
jgi:hypothetical protein